MMHELMGKEVEVITPEVVYRGTLIEITETEIHLQSSLAYITIPMERVISLKAVD